MNYPYFRSVVRRSCDRLRLLQSRCNRQCQANYTKTCYKSALQNVSQLQ